MYQKITEWLDSILNQEIPESVVAFCFNLYEDGDNQWSMELVGTETFDEEDGDWACDEVTDFDSREHNFEWTSSSGWKEILEQMATELKLYLEKGKHANKLKSKEGVGVGFVDGDIEIIYQG
ncbi:MAG: hypothetical protein HDT30_11305 [Clostridiales bacterium]|nr:hypothetical protein [Clostridiales bacterium]